MQSVQTIKGAFERFESTIHTSDIRLFRSTTLQDVREAARIIERDQAERKCMRNLRRVRPLLEGLGKFAGALDALCQGTPYLSYIWVTTHEPMSRNHATNRPRHQSNYFSK